MLSDTVVNYVYAADIARVIASAALVLAQTDSSSEGVPPAPETVNVERAVAEPVANPVQPPAAPEACRKTSRPSKQGSPWPGAMAPWRGRSPV